MAQVSNTSQPVENIATIDANQINYARVLYFLRAQGSASRTEITRATGLRPSTVTGITRDLIAKGYVTVGETVASGRGRPSEYLIYDAESRVAFGIELHNGEVFGVVTDLYARPLESHRISSVGNGLDAVLDAIEQWGKDVQPRIQSKPCVAIGIAVPGFVEPIYGKTVFSSQFDLPPDVPIVDMFEERLGMRPAVTNRTYAAALAETWIGGAQDANNVVYIRLGDDIGGAMLINGLPYLGSGSNGAAAVAHIIVDPKGQICRCGSRGCLDTVASGNAIAHLARAAIKKGRKSIIEESCGGNLDLITGTMVANAAHNGDTVAQDIMQEAADWIGQAAGVCISLLGPDTIILGGEIPRIETGLTESVASAARRYAYSRSRSSTRFITSKLGDDGIACGAAANALWANLTKSIAIHPG